jgi:DNA-binding NarL/FixJ family response regulator
MSMGRLEHEGGLRAVHSLDDIRVLIVGDHKLFADALRWVLEGRGMKIVGVTNSGEEALAIALRERPELVLLDVNLAGMSGLVVGKQILEKLPETKMVAVTSVDHPRVIKKAFTLGFHGYLTMDVPISQFSASLSAVLAGQVVISKDIAPSSDQFLPDERAELALADQLSHREREILALFVEGLNNTQIAERLGIADNTVRAHAQRILAKLQVHSRLEAAAFAVRHGLLDRDDKRSFE